MLSGLPQRGLRCRASAPFIGSPLDIQCPIGGLDMHRSSVVLSVSRTPACSLLRVGNVGGKCVQKSMTFCAETRRDNERHRHQVAIVGRSRRARWMWVSWNSNLIAPGEPPQDL